MQTGRAIPPPLQAALFFELSGWLACAHSERTTTGALRALAPGSTVVAGMPSAVPDLSVEAFELKDFLEPDNAFY